MAVPTISELPEVPSRSTQEPEEFSLAVDNFFTAFPVMRTEMNAAIFEINVAVQQVTGSVAAASAAADRAEAASGFRVSVAAASWAALSAIAGSYAGQTAAVYDDGGTHTDPVVGGTVDNAGIYAWSVSPAGWQWLDDGSTSAIAWGDITDKPSTFTPATHTHSISDVTGLQTALDGKALAGAVGSSLLTMATSRLLGRVAGGSGAVQEIALGTGLAFDGTTLKYTGSTDMVYPGAGIAVSTGSGWGTSLAAPGGNLVGTSASQTLTNKTLGSGTSITAGTISGVTVTGGTIQAGVSISDSGTIGASSPGFRGLPRITGSSRTLTDSDEGKLISLTGNFTLPNGLPIGFSCVLYNNSGSNSTVSAAGTLRLAGTADTGSRTLAQRGLASVVVVASNEWAIAGNVS